MPKIQFNNDYRVVLHPDPYDYLNEIRFEFSHPFGCGEGWVQTGATELSRDNLIVGNLQYLATEVSKDDLLDGLVKQIDSLLRKDKNPCEEIVLPLEQRKTKEMHALEAQALEQGVNIKPLLNELAEAVRNRSVTDHCGKLIAGEPGKHFIPGRFRVKPLSEIEKDILIIVYGYIIRPVYEDVRNRAFYPPILKGQHVADEIIWYEE